MGTFYIDDSIHDKAGFILAACLYLDKDLTDEIDQIVASHGFKPENFEFKSSAWFSNHPEQMAVRSDLFRLLRHCRLAIVVIPRDKRDQLGDQCLRGLRQFVAASHLGGPMSIFADERIFNSKRDAERLFASNPIPNCTFFCEQDSKVVKGIQLADLAAHSASIQLKACMGLVTKMIKSGESSGVDPDSEIELGFQMWAYLRYSFFHGDGKEWTGDRIKDSTLDVEPYGLYVSHCATQALQKKREKHLLLFS